MRQWMRFGTGVLVSATAWACSSGDAVEVGIQTVEVTRGNLRIAAEAVGAIEPVRKVDVKSKASGEILRIYVQTGDQVLPGALLAEIDPRDVKNRYDQAVADQEVSTAQANNARAQLDRSTELHSAGVITDQELESNRLSFTNAQANLTRARTTLELAQLQLGDVTIRAPMAGTILSKSIEEGSVIQSASQSVSGGTALFVMASLEEMQVRALIDEVDIGRLRPGLSATISVQAYAGQTFQGTVQQVEPQAVVQQSVTKFPVIVTLVNRDNLLKPGMNAEVEILIDQVTDVLLLTNTAMVTMQDALPAARALGLDDSAVDPTVLNPQAAAGGAAAAGAGGGRAAQAGEGAAQPGQGAAQPGQGGQGGQGGQARQGAGGGGGFPGAGGGGGGRGGGGRGGQQLTLAARSAPRPMVVFVVDAAGVLSARRVTIGLNDWDRAQVISGLEEGDKVALVGAAQLQAQQDALRNAGGGLNPFAAPQGGRGNAGFGGGGGGGGRGGF